MSTCRNTAVSTATGSNAMNATIAGIAMGIAEIGTSEGAGATTDIARCYH